MPHVYRIVFTGLASLLTQLASAGGNTAPVINDPPPEEVIAFDQSRVFEIGVFDDDANLAALEVTGLPPGCFDQSNFDVEFGEFRIICQPPVGIDGTFPVELRATDSGMPPLSATRSFNILVDTQPPKVVSSTIYPGQQLTELTDVTLEFSEDLDPNTVFQNGFIL